MSDTAQDERHVGVQARSESRSYRWYVLGVLMLTYAFSFMDRQILSILLEDIRAEFTLTDTQLGLLSGIAFALFYATLGVPIARLADRMNRVKIVSIAVAVWSVMTALCGAAGSFVQLFAARIGVGIGEAGGGPPSHSIISDYFRKEERGFAISVYSLGPALGMLVGLAAGGYIAQHYGWRWAFVCAGVPGVLLALLVRTTLREPARGALDAEHASDASDGSFGHAIAVLFRNRVYLWTNIGHSAAVFVGYGFASWKPSLYLRQFDLSQSEVGAIIGVMGIVASLPGLLAGGLIADRLAKHDARWPGFFCAGAVLVVIPFYVLGLMAADWRIATGLFGLGLFCYQLSHGPGLAIVQSAVAPNQRALAASFVFMFANILGLGLGPLIVGAISDSASDAFAERSLAVALGVCLIALLVAGVGYARAGVMLGRRDGSRD
ncbi:MAG: MFS transporter [Pseudomonadota bacterium]